jgi:GTP diphosphokinase / guanosine-3',5'-bis(diphosphate) 3'-diphosphatase
MYSYRIEQAIRAASVLHKDQLRKGSMPFPYITHLMATAFTLLDYTKDEDVIIAALLHDSIEDTDYTIDELQEDFGGKVREIVEAVTEPKRDGEKKLTWREQKMTYVRQLKKAPKEALLVAAADKIHNFRTIVEDYTDSYDRYVQDFGKNFDDRLEVYQEIHDIIDSRLDSPIKDEFNHVFAEFKEFLYRIKDIDEGLV